MLKKSLILLAIIAFGLASCDDYILYPSTNQSDYYYKRNDHIIIAPRITDGTTSVEYLLDSTYTHTLTEMPFALELNADTLSLGYHILKVKRCYSGSTGVAITSTTTIDFTIL